MLSAKWHPFRLGLNVLKYKLWIRHIIHITVSVDIYDKWSLIKPLHQYIDI